MTLPSVTITLEIAPVQDGFIVQHSYYHNLSFGNRQGPTTTVHFNSRAELMAWLANMEINV